MTLVEVLTVIAQAGLVALRDYETRKDGESALKAAQEAIADARAQRKFPDLEERG